MAADDITLTRTIGGGRGERVEVDQQRPHPHPRTGQPTDFLFAEHGRRLKAWRIRTGLRTAATAAALAGPGRQPLNITPHQLRHILSA